MKQPGFFDVKERLARLSGFCDPLEAFSETVDFEAFRPDRDATLVAAPKQRNTNAEKADLREGQIPQDWQDKPLKPSHKDGGTRAGP